MNHTPFSSEFLVHFTSQLVKLPREKTMKPHTFRSIASDQNCEKRTVINWWNRAKSSHGELGEQLDGTRYFSDEERAILVSYAGEKTQPRKSKESVIDAEVIPEGFFQSSALAPVDHHELQLPGGFDPSAAIRVFDGVAGEATDIDTLEKLFDMACSSIEKTMENKIEQQRLNLSKAEAKAKKLTTKISETKTNLKVKALESQMLAERQTTATKTAEEIFAELMAMGKPVEQQQPSQQ